MTHKKANILRIIAAVVFVLLPLLYVIADHSAERWMASQGIAAIEDKLHTRLSVDSVDLQLFDGSIAFYKFRMEDQHHVTMLSVDTMSVKADVLALLNRDIILKEVKMHGATAVLYRQRKDTPANYQFVVDAFKPNKNKVGYGKNKKTEIMLDLQAADFNRLSLTWDVRSERQKGGDTLDMNHLRLENMHLSLHGKMQEKKTLNVTAAALRIHEMKSNLRLTLESGQYRTIGGRSLSLQLNDLRLSYQDKRFGFERFEMWQNSGQLRPDKDMSVQIDSLHYACNNGKPRKNTGRPNRGAFDPGHLDAVLNLEAEIHHASKDTISGMLRHLDAVDRGSGLVISSLSTFFDVHNRQADFTIMKVNLPRTRINIDKVSVLFPKKDKTDTSGPAGSNVTILPCRVQADVCLMDLAKPFAPALSHFTTPLSLSVDADGTMDCLNMRNIRINTPDQRLRLTAEGDICDILKKQKLTLHFTDIHLSARTGIKEQIVNHFAKKTNIKMQRQLENVGDIDFAGRMTIPYRHVALSGMIYTVVGNVDFGFDINSKTHYMIGSVRGRDIELGTLMNVDGLGAITANADFTFNTAYKRTLKQQGPDPGKLPIGTLRAQVSGVTFKGIRFRDIKADISSNGTTANGSIFTSVKSYDIMAEFQYTQTARIQSWNVQPRLTMHKPTAAEIRQQQREEREKIEKAEARAIREAEMLARQAELKATMGRIGEQVTKLKHAIRRVVSGQKPE